MVNKFVYILIDNAMYLQVKPKAIKKLILLRKGTQVLTLYGYHYQQTKHLQLLIPVLCDISSRSTRLEDKGEHQGGPARLFFLSCPPRHVRYASLM